MIPQQGMLHSSPFTHKKKTHSSSRDKTQVDETTRLRNRIAELESVIRSLNNRPHPRWLAPDGVTHDPSMVALRRGTRRRAKAVSKFARSASVEAFFDAIADEETNGDLQDCKIKVEQEAFTPEFTPSEAGPSHSSVGSPLTPISPLSPESPTSLAAPCAISSASSVPPVNGTTISAAPTPFSFQDAPYTINTTDGAPPVSSFVQGPNDDVGIQSCASGLPLVNCVSPAGSESSEDGPPLANLFPPSHSETESSAFAGDGFSGKQHYAVNHASVGIQTVSPSPECAVLPAVSSRFGSPEAPSDSSSPECRCLTDATVYGPLVHFASALRVSREALEALHPPLSSASSSSSNCILFRRITELDDHILYVSLFVGRRGNLYIYICVHSSASPPTPPMSPQSQPQPQPQPAAPVHDFLNNVYESPMRPSHPVLAPSSPSPLIFDSAVRHPHAHTLPFYSPTAAEDHSYLDPQTFHMTSTTDMMTYPVDAVYSQLRGWDTMSMSHT